MDANQLACCDASFPKLSQKTALAVVRDLGFSAVDICVLAGYDRNRPEVVLQNPHRAADSVNRELESAGLTVSDVFVILSESFDVLAVNHPDAAVRREAMRQFEAALQFCLEVRSPGLTILPGTTFAGIDPQASLELAAEELQRRAGLAGEDGLRLCVEPHYGSLAATPASALELLEQSPDVGLTLDYSHFAFQDIPQAQVDLLIPYAQHMHLRPAGPGDMQARAGHGTIDFGALLRQLAAAEYSGYLSLEYCWEEWMGLNDADCVSETAVLRDLLLAELDQLNTRGKGRADG